MAIENLNIFERENILQKLQHKINILTDLLKEFYELRHVGDVRQCGFMVGIELVKNKDKKEPYPVKDRIGYKVILEARKHGVIIRPLGDIVVLMPPLCITIDQLYKLCEVTHYSIKKITER